MLNPDEFAELGRMKVKAKSIPNVETDRLLARLHHLHGGFHTPEGLSQYEGTRRGLYDNGQIMLSIANELRNRKTSSGIDCKWCGVEGGDDAST
jgi:hypothetical protein